jgi:hypothetical protein
MQYLRYNTDSQEVVFGIFVDSTDGNTEETGLTIANTDIKIWKTGATTLANKNSGGATHISNGIYYAVFDATDTNTLGSGKAFIHVSGALYCILEFCVLPQKVYDSMIAGSDNLEVDTILIEGTDATDQINSACDTAISDAGVTTTRMGYVDYLANATYGLSAIETLVDEIETRLTAQRATNLDELGAVNIPADIDTLLSRLTALRAGYIDNLSGGAVALASGVTVSDKTGFSLSSSQSFNLTGNITGNLSGSVGSVTGGVTVTTNNDKTGYTASTISDKTGYSLSTAGVSAIQSGLSTLTAADVWSYATRTLSSFGTLVSDITTAVWGATTRTLSAFGFTVAATVADKTGYSLSSAGVTSVQSGLSKTADITALNNISVADILAGETESGLTLKHAMQIITALALKATGGGTSSISFRNYGDTKNRLTMTVDEDGNRTAVTISLD